MNYEKSNVLGYTYIRRKVHKIEVLTNLLLDYARNKAT